MQRIRRLPMFALGMLLLVAGTTALRAADVAPTVLAMPCTGCHGPDGASPGAMPSIAKTSAADMTAKLKAFRAGTVEATVMTRIAKGYTDVEIDSIGQYFAALPH